MFSFDEVGYVVHRPGTVEGVHGYEILECRRLKFAEILLHTGRLELECAYGLPLAVKFVCLGVVDGYGIDVEFEASGVEDVRHRFLDDG